VVVVVRFLLEAVVGGEGEGEEPLQMEVGAEEAVGAELLH
jgi:hypothetical protein